MDAEDFPSDPLELSRPLVFQETKQESVSHCERGRSPLPLVGRAPSRVGDLG